MGTETMGRVTVAAKIENVGDIALAEQVLDARWATLLTGENT